jgi:Ser/Thr protein kinase RdoA (MazF antagonist)
MFLNDAEATKLLVEKEKPTLKRTENWLENHGPDKAELLLYLRDFFVYGSEHAIETLMKRVQAQREKLTDLDIQVLYHGIVEECRHANVVSKYSVNGHCKM